MNTDQLYTLRTELRAKLELLDTILGIETASAQTPQPVQRPAVPAAAKPLCQVCQKTGAYFYCGECNGTGHQPAEAPPRPKDPSPKPVRGNQGSHRVLTFQEVAQHMADGPKGIGYLRDKLKSDPKTIKKCMEHHNLLFRRSNPDDRLSPWELTDEGRKELAG